MVRFLTIVLLLLVLLGVGFYFYQRNIAAVPVTAADLEKGGATAAERTALTTACAARIKKDRDKVCGCIAGDKFASQFY